MRWLIRKLRGEAGQSAILVALTMVVLCGMAAFAVDIGVIAVDKGQLQTAADAAALAGAGELPTASTARSKAIQYAGKNGVASSEVTATTPYKGDSNKIEVVCTRTVEYSFARIFGLTSTTVSARAVAEKSGMSGGPFGYTVFSGSQSDTLTFNGSGQYIGGSAHSNNKFRINGSSQTITGNAEAVTNFTANGSSITISGTCQAASITTHGSSINIGNTLSTPAAVIDMPDFSDLIKAQAEAAGTKYTGNITYNGSSLDLDHPIYVEGNVTINGSHFSGTGFILATGNITFNGSNLKSSSGASVCFYSQNGDITVNGSSAVLEGIVYAPNGTITMNGSNQTINGRVIGYEIDFNGSSTTIISGSNDLNCLPGSSVRLVE